MESIPNSPSCRFDALFSNLGINHAGSVRTVTGVFIGVEMVHDIEPNCSDFVLALEMGGSTRPLVQLGILR